MVCVNEVFIILSSVYRNRVALDLLILEFVRVRKLFNFM